MNREKATAVQRDFCRFFCALRLRASDAVTGNPAIASLAAVIALLLLVFCAGLNPWLAILFVLPVLCILLPFRTVLCCILPSLAAVTLSLLFRSDPSRELEDDLINRRAYGEFEVRITDRSVDPAGPAAKMVRADLLKFRLAGEKDWSAPANPVPIGLTGLEKSPGYEDEIRLNGFLFEPDEPLLSGTFNYKEYLAREGITFLLRRDKDLEPVLQSRGSGISRFFYDFRSKTLAKMTSGMRSEEAKALASGIFFGISRDLSPETKADFLRSGTIHILTVSGTHVGFFALLVFCLCPYFSFRGRVVCVILLTACYVWLTGLNEPSIRAWIMLTCFQLVRVFRFRTKSLNTLALAALILLIADPDDLFSTGFQFSFLVVTVLLMSIPLVKEVRTTLFPDHLLVPASQTTQTEFFFREQGRRLLGAVLATGVAALAGTALAAYYQGLFSGSSVLANFLLLPAVAISFPAAVLAGISDIFVPFLEDLLLLILAVNRSLAETGVLTFAKPPLWSVILMTVLLLLLFLPEKGFWKIPVVCGILLIPLWWHFRTVLADPELLILAGKDRNFVVVLTEPDRRSAIVINLPDYAAASEVSAFLKCRGITDCRIFAASDHFFGSVAGLDHFASRTGLQEAYLFDRQRRKCVGSYPVRERKDVFFLKNDLKIVSERDNFNAVFSGYGISVTVVHYENGTSSLTVNGKEQLLCPALTRSYLLYRAEPDGLKEIGKSMEMEGCGRKK